MTIVEHEIKIINKSSNPLPSKGSINSAAVDLQANLVARPLDDYKGDGFSVCEDNNPEFDIVKIHPNGRVLIPTGLYIELPVGYHADIKSRSGNALKLGLHVLNADGLIDSDYRGEIGVILHNTSNKDKVYINHGMKIAQMLVAKDNFIKWIPVTQLSDTARGEGGFGSSDVK